MPSLVSFWPGVWGWDAPSQSCSQRQCTETEVLNQTRALAGICSWALRKVKISQKWAAEQWAGSSSASPGHLRTRERASRVTDAQ